MAFNNKGQGALEYLLLIGGAIIVAVIVIGALSGLATDQTKGKPGPFAAKCAAITDADLAKGQAKCESAGWTNFDNDTATGNTTSNPDYAGADCKWDNVTDQCVPWGDN